jgi:glycosyltransferase involved in cell wall biosynthesis
MINKADRFVCVAQHTLNSFRKLGDIRTEAKVINNALADIYVSLSKDSKLSLRNKYHVGVDTKIVLFVGRLDEVKGLHFMIKAFGKLLKTYPDIHLFVLGDGDFNKCLKEASDSWAKITFTGRLEKKKLYEFYSLADMGVVCSLHEEFGFVAIEMMMHELPVIVTKTGGLDEIVEEGVSGLKVPVRTKKGVRQVDVKALAAKMDYLLSNPDEAMILGKNGRKRFLEKYELSIFRKKILELYDEL